MIAEKHIIKLVEAKLKGSDNFLVEVVVRSGNRIMVFIDSDSEVKVDDCIALSRHIEGSLDRDTEDFDLVVSSSGLDQPFKQLRQYKKYLNRKIVVEFEDGKKVTAVLTGIGEEEITIKELTKKHKSKAAVEGPEKKVLFSDIKETKPAVDFSK